MNRAAGIKKFFLMGFILGTIFFIALWGVKYLNIFYIDWMMTPSGSDFSFTGTASIAFLKEPWSFPPGIINTLLHPNKTCIIYTDAIPILALFFKLLTTIIPLGTFQYFGLWGLLCFSLQGGFAAVILKKYSSSYILCALGSIFFILSPFICGRMFAHASMAGQWIILAAIAILVQRELFFVKKNEIYLWISVCALSVLILTYFTPMVYSMWLIYAICRIMDDTNKIQTTKRMLCLFLYTVLACVISFWVCGGLSTGTLPGGMDYGVYPFNLNGFFNPTAISHFIKEQTPDYFTMEGFAWLGLGIIIGLVLCFFHQIEKGRPSRAIIIKSLPFIIVSAMLIAFAATNKMMFGNTLILNIHLPDPIIKLCSTFRTSGRFIWPVFYLIYVYVIGSLISRPVPWFAKVISIGLLLLIQIFDFSNFYNYYLQKRKPESVVVKKLQSDFWSNIGSNYKRMYFLPFSGKITNDYFSEIVWVAVQNNISLNSFWLGRYPFALIYSAMDKKIAELNRGKMDDQDIILLNRLNILSSIELKGNMRLYRIDGMFALLNKQEENFENISRIQKYKVGKGSLVTYLAHLKREKSNKIIILSARDANGVIFDDETQKILHDLGVKIDLKGKLNHSFIAVIKPNDKVIFEKFSPESLELHDENNNPAVRFDITENLNYSLFPEVKINGEDCSQSFLGLNICIYDIKDKYVEEIALFELYDKAEGLWVYKNVHL